MRDRVPKKWNLERLFTVCTQNWYGDLFVDRNKSHFILLFNSYQPYLKCIYALKTFSGRLNFITRFLHGYVAASFPQNNSDKVDTYCHGDSVCTLALQSQKSSSCFLL